MTHDQNFPSVLAALIQFAGAVVIVWHGLSAIADMAIRRKSIEMARLQVLDGALSALGFTLAATLLRLLTLQSWQETGTFAAIFVLRTGIKTAMKRERLILLSRG